MADVAMDLQEQIARIERMQEETRKFVAESHELAAEQLKLSAEQQKLVTDAMKVSRDHALAPWQIIIGAMTAGAALFGAGVAVMKVLGDSPTVSGRVLWSGYRRGLAQRSQARICLVLV